MDSFAQCVTYKKYIYIAAAITGAFSVCKTGEVSLRQTFLIFLYMHIFSNAFQQIMKEAGGLTTLLRTRGHHVKPRKTYKQCRPANSLRSEK